MSWRSILIIEDMLEQRERLLWQQATWGASTSKGSASVPGASGDSPEGVSVSQFPDAGCLLMQLK